MVDFYLQQENAMEANVKTLEEVCKKALESGETVVLHSPLEFRKPKSVYELSVILAEDMVKKYNENNVILRN